MTNESREFEVELELKARVATATLPLAASSVRAAPPWWSQTSRTTGTARSWR